MADETLPNAAAELNIWYAIPSANVGRAEACLRKWKQKGYRIAVAFDKGMPEIPSAELHMWMDPYPGYFPTVNQMCARILKDHGADIIVTGGDDM
ncbi:MAG: hypothetical protein GTO63_06970, partial [Anaerolineae bacterium]|nr:hypothetical protein [Anaerolineae bacterium]NIN94681.1 hypothetical protein [Anaerolineae bacterium]NIQ77743.1 hypothetical protein [Anaerolineae bacterium]